MPVDPGGARDRTRARRPTGMTATLRMSAPGRVLPAATGCIVLGVAAAALASIDVLFALAIIAAVGALAALRWPDLATILLAAILYSNAVVVAVRFEGAPAAVAVLPPALLLLPLVHHFVIRREPVVWSATTSWLLVFAVGASLSALLSDDLSAALGPYSTFLAEGLVLFILLTNVVRSWYLLRLIVVTVVTIGAALGAMSLVANIAHRDYASFHGFAQVTEGTVANATDWRTWEEWQRRPCVPADHSESRTSTRSRCRCSCRSPRTSRTRRAPGSVSSPPSRLSA